MDYFYGRDRNHSCRRKKNMIFPSLNHKGLNHKGDDVDDVYHEEAVFAHRDYQERQEERAEEYE